MKKKWSRGDKLAVVAIIVTVVASLFPEVRRKLGLEKPATMETPAQAQTSTSPSATAPSQIPPTPTPISPSSRTAQRARPKVKGDNNVAGNNVTGSGNVVGNNNQSTVVNAPGGMPIINNTGTITNPTVNNAPIERHLNSQQIAALAQVSIPPDVKLVIVTGEDSDSQQFAYEIYHAIDPKQKFSYYSVGLGRMPPLPRGVFIGVRDEAQLKLLSPIGERISKILNTPATPVQWGNDGSLSDGNLEILVGPR